VEALRAGFEGTRIVPLVAGLTPTMVVALTAELTGRALIADASVVLLPSPALSASVFLLVGGSGSPVPLCFSVAGGGISARTLLSEFDISSSPDDAGMRLGGRSPVDRIVRP